MCLNTRLHSFSQIPAGLDLGVYSSNTDLGPEVFCVPPSEQRAGPRNCVAVTQAQGRPVSGGNSGQEPDPLHMFDHWKGP